MSKKPVLKILKKCVVLIIPVYLLWFLYIELMPEYYNRPTNTRWHFIKESLKKKHIIPDSEIIFLGESRVNAGIDFTQIPNSYSFASGGATTIEMYYILEKYCKNYQKPETVYLSISPRFLTEVFAFYPYVVRNNLLNYSDMKEICSALQKNDTTLGSFPKIKFLLNKVDYIEYYQSDVLYNNVFGGHKENLKLINEMIKRKGGRPHPGLKDSCSALNYETKYNHFKPAVILTVYFKKILEFCKNKNIKLSFFFMPMNESSYRVLNSKFKKEYKEYISKFQKQYPEFNISDSVYFYPDTLFGDESHLNLKGKQIFTEQFLKEQLN
ncbi:MAG: hypothetical protein L3J35_11080 [Bacteroidales bacterium]|nr:hypothetical protein [Bacteroidales bacterium]